MQTSENLKLNNIKYRHYSKYKLVQSNLDYPNLNYPDYSIIRTFFSGPVFHELPSWKHEVANGLIKSF